ncbi:hypothetical protein U1Q18_040938 [Sarracenia purpurea var. burkii]
MWRRKEDENLYIYRKRPDRSDITPEIGESCRECADRRRWRSDRRSTVKTDNADCVLRFRLSENGQMDNADLVHRIRLSKNSRSPSHQSFRF